MSVAGGGLGFSGTQNLRDVHPEVRRWAIIAARVAAALGVRVRFTSGFRSFIEQQLLRQRFERGESRFPANRPGDSAHNYGLAFDSTVAPEHERLWRRIREIVGFHVPSNDEIHAEVPNWRALLL